MNMLPLCMRARVSAWQQGAGTVRWILLTDTLTAVSHSRASAVSQTKAKQRREGRKELETKRAGDFTPK